jgi:histidine ammonia-lyase
MKVLKGNHLAFDKDIHEARPHNGQGEVAKRIRSLLCVHQPSNLHEAFEVGRKVQDAYTLRCVPQVHGTVIDTINFAKNIINIEMNSATDNPMVLQERNMLVSGGNFHGNYPAKALDILAIGIQDLANMSERRIERLVNNSLNEGLPAFLVAEQGLNSGFMIAHCTAAALTSENKVLCHPSSIDTLSTSKNEK